MKTRATGHYISLVCCILLLTASAGCTQSPLLAAKTTIPANDPEIGIVSWMDAMNRQDIIHLYKLSPSYVRSNVTLEQFATENRDNIYFVRNTTFVRYEIINKSVSGNTADIRAMLVMNQQPLGDQPRQSIPLWFHFTLAWENNEWKVWTVPY